MGALKYASKEYPHEQTVEHRLQLFARSAIGSRMLTLVELFNSCWLVVDSQMSTCHAAAPAGSRMVGHRLPSADSRFVLVFKRKGKEE